MELCVVGLGKIGLPIAVQAAVSGVRVRGVDISPTVVDLVNSACEPFPGELDLDRQLQLVVGNGGLTAGTDTVAAVSESDAVIIVVPLIVNAESEPDFGAMDAATAAVAAGLQPGVVVIYETTMPVFTTRRRFAPELARISGLELGENLFVVHSPERVFSGRIFSDLRRYPKLVGGLDEESTKRGVDVYEEILQFDDRDDLSRPNGVWAMSSAEAAEFAKLAETTYRNVNIGLANEFSEFAEDNGLDVHEVIEASNSQPFSAIHRPGVAVGGHCIPVYPKFYLTNHPSAALPAASIRRNESMPERAVEAIRMKMGGTLKGRRVVVLGAAYRGGVRETAFSGVFPLVNGLTEQDALPLVHDPLYSDDELRSMGFEPHRMGGRCDIAILQADHEEYQHLGPADLPGILLFYDGRGVTDQGQWPGVWFLQLGVGD
jgi:nucleotide sugar dehydrogenase